MLDFPDNPTTGDVFQNWEWDGAKWIIRAADGAYLPLTGGTITGPLTVVGHNLFVQNASIEASETVAAAGHLAINAKGDDTIGWKYINNGAAGILDAIDNSVYLYVSPDGLAAAALDVYQSAEFQFLNTTGPFSTFVADTVAARHHLAINAQPHTASPSGWKYIHANVAARFETETPDWLGLTVYPDGLGPALPTKAPDFWFGAGGEFSAVDIYGASTLAVGYGLAINAKGPVPWVYVNTGPAAGFQMNDPDILALTVHPAGAAGAPITLGTEHQFSFTTEGNLTASGYIYSLTDVWAENTFGGEEMYCVADAHIGGDLTVVGRLALSGNASVPLQAVPLQQLQLYLPLAGGWLTGDVTINRGRPTLVLSAPTGNSSCVIASMVNYSTRWLLNLSDGSPETGGNAGSNFLLSCYGDGGSWLSNPIMIERATGVVSVNQIATLLGGGTAWAFHWDYANAFISPNNSGWYQVTNNSDERLKQDIAPSTFDCLGTVERLPLHRFRWRNGAAAPLVPIGLVAQRVAEVEPSLVNSPPPPHPSSRDDGSEPFSPLGINTTTMLAALIGAIQQLSKQMQGLNKRIDTMEGSHGH